MSSSPSYCSSCATRPEATATYDLVLLDVDNGPGHLVHAAHPAPELAQALEEVFGSCTEHRHDVLLQGRAEQYLLYLSRRP